jgi:hypothetical protein
MAGSYDRRPGDVRTGTCLHIAALLAVCVVAAPPGPAAQPAASDTVLLQLRIFSGTEDVTKETRVNLYPRGRRTGEIPLTLGADSALESNVAPGFYDIQFIHERRGQVAGMRWVEHVLVQRYPDEYGRHLQVLNLSAGFGALQVRAAPGDGPAARGWSASAHPPGDATREVGAARPVGGDLLVVLPAGRYDIRVTLNDRTTSWIRDVDIPADRTRLKTWSASSPVP